MTAAISKTRMGCLLVLSAGLGILPEVVATSAECSGGACTVDKEGHAMLQRTSAMENISLDKSGAGTSGDDVFFYPSDWGKIQTTTQHTFRGPPFMSSKYFSLKFSIKMTGNNHGSWGSLFMVSPVSQNKNDYRAPAAWIYPNRRRLHVRMRRSGSTSDGLDIDLPYNTWTHVAIDLTAADGMVVYFNGVKKGQDTDFRGRELAE